MGVQRLKQGSFYRGRRVLVTGHTGFKGTWLCWLLSALGAEVYGYALAPASGRPAPRWRVKCWRISETGLMWRGR